MLTPSDRRRAGAALAVLVAGPALALSAGPATSAPVDPTFSFAVLPDTQQEVLKTTDPRFKNRTNWLVANKTALDLRFVTHTGDWVNWDTPDHSQYAIAAAAMSVLHAGGIKYSVAPGNHDTAAVCAGGGACDPKRTKQLVRDTSTFNAYQREADFGAVTERFEAGKVDNAFSTFSAGGLNWGVLTLELWPRVAAVDWARRVVAAHPHHNIMIVTHSYLEADGSIGTSSEYGATSPQYLWTNLVSQYPNIKLVFCGHTGQEATRTDTGVNGNRVYSFLGAFHDNKTNPTRLVDVDTAANTLSSRIYSPFTNKAYPEYDHRITGVTWVR